MAGRQRQFLSMNAGELGRGVIRIWRPIDRQRRLIWRGYLERIAHTNPDDTRLAPHRLPAVRPASARIDQLVIRESVLDAIVRGAWQYPELETGEALVGIVEMEDGAPPRNVVRLLGTIAPDESAIREWGTVQMGDEEQYDRFLWLADNWAEDCAAAGRDNRSSLKHLGDWHKHPGGMSRPSRGDLRTAREILRDEYWRLPFILQPIVTFPPAGFPSSVSMNGNYLIHEDADGRRARIDFWYLSREANQYQPLAGLLEGADDRLPQLAPLPWHLRAGVRWEFEQYHLRQNGYADFDMLYFNSDDRHPLEICFFLKQADGRSGLLIATQWDYPKSAPQAFLLQLPPVEGPWDWLAAVREAWPARKLIAPDSEWRWSEERSLGAFLRMIERQLASVADGRNAPTMREP